VKTLPERLPISDRIAWSQHHDSHKDHWVKWLADYSAGIGYYGRKNHKRDAGFIWSHLQCAGMLIYLAEAAGVETATVRRAVQIATTAAGNCAAVSAATRRVLPWPRVCRALFEEQL
jgi:hypothetical protein